MSYNIVESMVRQRLREKNGQVYCAECLAKDLEQDPTEVRAAMDGSVKRAAPPLRAIAGRARRHPVAFSDGSPEWPVNPPTWFDERGQPARISDSA
jgi:hypothetical protein